MSNDKAKEELIAHSISNRLIAHSISLFGLVY